MPRAALYCRVSTSRQSCDNQLLELRTAAAARQWDVVAEYADVTSGATSTRPGLDQLMKDAVRRRFDVVMCWDISRLGRSVPHLVQTVEEMRALKIDLYFFQQAVDTSTPAGKLCFQIFASLAEWEREMIRERVRAGLEAARSKGVKLGRPSKMNNGLHSAIVLLRSKGVSIKRIAHQLEVGVGTVYKALQGA